MYVQPGSLSQTPIQMAFDVAGLGGLWICHLIKTSPLFSFYLFCNPFFAVSRS